MNHPVQNKNLFFFESTIFQIKSDYLKAYANNKSDIFVWFLLLTIDLNFTCSSKTFVASTVGPQFPSSHWLPSR